jgi:hypothetical protein
VLGIDSAYRGEPQVWRGPNAGPKAPRSEVPSIPLEAIADGEIGAAHRVKLWSTPNPEAILVCADGAGLEGWAGVIAASPLRVALVGIDSAGRVWSRGELPPAPPPGARLSPDRRARAYIATVDPPYFRAHMDYVVGVVLPWADERLGLLPKLAFGVSNGADWAAAAASLHPDEFAGALVFSLAHPPASPPAGRSVHALVAGQLEPPFDRSTTAYASALRAHGHPVRLRRPVRGHDYGMWTDELTPALEWVLATLNADPHS